MKANQRQAVRHNTQPPRLRHISRRSKWWFIVGGVAGAIALFVVLTNALSGPEAKGTEVAVPVGAGPGSSASVTSSTLPDFSLALYQGEEFLGTSDPRFVSLLGKKPIVINYWASACPPCEAEMPELEKVWRIYKERVLVLGLDIGRFAGYGGPDTSRKTLSRLGITYPAAPAPDFETLQRLEVKGLPSTAFITASGKIQKQWVGILNEAKLTELVEDLLKTQ